MCGDDSVNSERVGVKGLVTKQMVCPGLSLVYFNLLSPETCDHFGVYPFYWNFPRGARVSHRELGVVSEREGLSNKHTNTYSRTSPVGRGHGTIETSYARSHPGRSALWLPSTLPTPPPSFSEQMRVSRTDGPNPGPIDTWNPVHNVGLFRRLPSWSPSLGP